MKIVYMGSGEFGLPSLERLVKSGHDLCEVITAPARPAGRGQKLRPTAVTEYAKTLHLSCTESADVNEPAMVDHLCTLEPEAIVVIAFGQKIGTELIRLPDCRVMNLHASLLPKYRGAAPINWAIINGEKETGVTIFQINEGWDTGAILGRATLAIGPEDTGGDLHDRLAQLGPDLWDQVLGQIQNGTIKPIVQDDTQASRAPKLKKSDGAIRWNRSAEIIRNQIHGLWPWPGAFCQFQQQNSDRYETLTIARACISEEATSASSLPGTLDNDQCVCCGCGRLKLVEVKPANGKLMSFADFANGRRLQPNDRFVDGQH